MRIGIDVGGTNLKAGLVDEEGNILTVCRTPVGRFTDGQDFAKVLAELALKAAAQGGVRPGKITGVGIGIPGAVREGQVLYTCNLPLRDVPLADWFRETLDVPVRLGNDADCAVIGESVFGDMKGVQNAVMVTLGTGVGTGTLVKGNLISGFKGAGGEGGHTVIRMGGEKCGCGRRGCWEAYASATALIRDTKRAMEKHPESLMNEIAKKEGKVTGRTAFDAMNAGDKTAKALVSRYIRYVGEGLVNIGNYIRPEIIFMGGGISNQGDWFIKRLQAYVTRYSYGGKRNPYITVVKATLKNEAGILGAAALVAKSS